MKRSWLKRLMPRRKKSDPFIERLLTQTRYVIDGADAVAAFMTTPTKLQARQIHYIEASADQTRRALVRELKRTFITSIDREDLFSLSRAIDDVLDYLYAVTRQIYLLQVVPNAHLHNMASTMCACARALHDAVAHLSQDSNVANDHTVRARALVNHMDTLYVNALTALFEDVSTPEEIVHVLKLREIYRDMIHAANSAEQAANMIQDIIVKFY